MEEILNWVTVSETKLAVTKLREAVEWSLEDKLPVINYIIVEDKNSG
jgi:hypothetical protein